MRSDRRGISQCNPALASAGGSPYPRHSWHYLNVHFIGLLTAVIKELATLRIAAKEKDVDEFVASYICFLQKLPLLVSVFPCIQFPGLIQQSIEDLKALCPSRCICIDVDWQKVWSSAGHIVECSTKRTAVKMLIDKPVISSDVISVHFDLPR